MGVNQTDSNMAVTAPLLASSAASKLLDKINLQRIEFCSSHSSYTLVLEALQELNR